GGLVFCLRCGEGQRDRCLDEIEGTALGGGRLADFLEAGAADGDGSAGQGGEVVQEPAEAVQDLAVGAGAGGGLGVGVRGAPGGGDRAGLGGGLLVGVCQRGQRCAQVPGEVGGEHADQHVRADPVLEPVVDRPQVQVVGLHDPEVPFDVLEVLVGGDGAGGIECAGGQRGADDVDAVERGLGVDGGLVPPPGQGIAGDVEGEVLGHLVLVDHASGPHADLVLTG